MSIRKILLLALLIIYSYSYYENTIIIEDYEKCSKATSSYSTTTEECTAITPTLIGTGDFESKCCRLTVTIDPFERFKSKYGENWKQKYMEILKINEEELEKEIAKRYSLAEKISFCNILNKKFKNVYIDCLLGHIMVKLVITVEMRKKLLNSKIFIQLLKKKKFTKTK